MYQLPLIVPDSDWQRPSELPDLRNRPWIALDTETRDDSLAAERGPGWPYRAGYICGVGWHAPGSEGYAPIRHPDSDCFDKEVVARWLQDHIDAGVRLRFQNAPYDVGWFLADLGVRLPLGHPIDDALAMDFMLDENHLTYNLGDICKRRGLPGKDEKALWEAASVYLDPGQAARGQRAKKFVLTNKIVKSNLWRLPARYVGVYGATDPRITAQAIDSMDAELDVQKVREAYDLEMRLVPVVAAMRERGIRVDVDATERDVRVFAERRDAVLAEIGRQLPGRRAPTIDDLRTNKWMEPTFESEGIRFPRTEKTNVGSFTKEWMEKHPHWLPRLCVKAEQYESMSTKFLGEFILGFAHRGRIHAEIHQYKSDDGGTVSYRLSISDPPLQQAPSPDINAELGLAFREKFVADEGEIWHANDYSQQEYRLTAHFAALVGVAGGEDAVRAYRVDPDLDYHKFVADLTGLTRARAKIQNFAVLYGEGLRATAAKLGIPIEEAQAIRKKIEEKAPFGPALDDYVKRRAQRKGYVRLLDGARCRFDKWEAGWLDKEERDRGYRERWPMGPCSEEEAKQRRKDERHPWHGVRLKRAFVHKAMNRLIQGSAARMTKMAMWRCAEAGLIPILQMHDELSFSDADPAVGAKTAEIMKNVWPTRVPMKVDAGSGPNWARAKEK